MLNGVAKMTKKQVKVKYEPIDDPVLPDVRKTAQMVEIEERFGGRDIRLVIRDLYNEHGSQRVVAETLGLEQSTITYWALRLNIVFTQQPVAVINTL
jgi:hypothetical protein